MNTVDRTIEAHTVAKEIFTIYEHFEDCEPSLETIKKVQGIIQRALESVQTEQGRELQAYKACLNSLGWVPGIYWSPEEGLMGHDLPTNMEYLTLKSENERLKREGQTPEMPEIPACQCGHESPQIACTDLKRNREFQVWCPACWAHGSSKDTREEAIDAWESQP